MLSFLFWIGAAVLLWRIVASYGEGHELRRIRYEEFARWESLAKRDPKNASAWANMADYFAEIGEMENAIEHYRRAIGLMPQGPFTAKWKRSLRDILDAQATLARGEKVLTIDQQRACHNCHKLVKGTLKNCPHCGAILNMNAAEFLSQPHIAKAWAKETFIAAAVGTLVLWIGGLWFLSLPIEVRGTLIISSVIVGGWLIIRQIGSTDLM